MQTANMHDAKSQLSRLVDDALAGEKIIIAKGGKPLVRLVSFWPPQPLRMPGHFKGKIQLADDFDDLPVELLAALQGKSD